MNLYRKYVYWITPEEAGMLLRDRQVQGVRVSRAKGVVCTPLDERKKIAVVSPEVWNQTCSRMGSWYRASEKNGLFLVVSSFDLELRPERKAAIITRSDFSPERIPTAEEKEEMIRHPGFCSRMPPEWESVAEREKRIYLRWAHKLGSTVTEFSELFLSQTANHANFLAPRFFVDESGEQVPYSIDVSAHLCSCCLELFQVLGGEYRRKLVRPCPGAVMFAELQPDIYLLVEKP